MRLEGPQAGEWPVLRALLPDDPVTYVDVGAGDPIDCNNTWMFYKTGGYGVLVEPLDEFWPELWAKRPRDTLHCCACLDADETSRPLRVCGTVSSFREDWKIRASDVRPVRTSTLDSILRHHPEIAANCQLCSIDVEGVEEQVIRGADWTVFRPEVLIVEYIKFDPHVVGEDLSGAWKPLLEAAGYRECCRSWLNIIFLREDLWQRWENLTVELPHAMLPHSLDSYRRRMAKAVDGIAPCED